MSTSTNTPLFASAISSGNCCGQLTSAPAVPLVISNPPGLSAIRYRIGTFTSFRQAMLDSIALPDLMATSVTTLSKPVTPGDTNVAVLDVSRFPVAPNFRIKLGSEYLQVTGGAGTPTWKVARGAGAAHSTGDAVFLAPPNPFAGWHPGGANDYQTMFVELWAYLADILTFYQERVANEAYLGTASQRDSLLRLVSLIDYRPAPGAAASSLVAFTAAKGRSATVPAGFRVGSKPSPGRPSVTFETMSAVDVSGDNSIMNLSPVSPDVPFPPNTIVLQGINNRLAVDDFVLAIEHQGTRAERAHLLQLNTVSADKSANTTTVTWQQEMGGGRYVQASKHVKVYAFRVTAAPFGANAPQWDTLSPTLTNPDRATFPNAPYQVSWEIPSLREFDFFHRGLSDVARTSFGTGLTVGSITMQPSISEGFVFLRPNPWFYIPAVDDPSMTVLFLDATYRQLNYTQQNQGWAVLLTDGDIFQVLHVTDARQAAKVQYTLSSKVTRLTFAEAVWTLTFPLRNTTVLTGVELLPLQIDLPLPNEVSGNRLILQGVHALLSGQRIVVSGTLSDPAPSAARGTPASETCVLDGPAQPDPANNITVVALKNSLAQSYVRATCSAMANIVEVTQGQTVKDEVLGSGDGSAFQSYALKKNPLTYLPSSDAESLSAVTSTLTVSVNGVAWNEQPDLTVSTPDAQDFTVTQDGSGRTTVTFGDGFNGARPSSGANNIHARYRYGLGSSGNLSTDSIRQLIDNVPNVQKVTNPVPSSGGSDPDAPSQIRGSAPASLRTFGRAVSASDYAALALTFPGISKATAIWIVSDPVTQKPIEHPYVQLTVTTLDQISVQGTLLAGKLRRFLDSRRDPNVLLRLQDFSPVFLEVALQVDIDPRFSQQATIGQVQAALNPGVNADGSFGYFAFQRLQFGQTIFLSAVYAIVQSIPGVKDVGITSLRRVGPGSPEPAGTAHDVIVGPTEIAVIGVPGSGTGQLTVSGQGGFLDT